MKDPINIVCAGSGMWGCEDLVSRIKRTPGCRLVAVWDSDLERGLDCAEGAGCLFAEDFQELLRHATVDAVAFSECGAQSADAVIAALGAGKNIYVERPLDGAALGWARQIRDAIDTVQRTRNVHAFFAASPVHPIAEHAKRMLAQGLLREPLNVVLRLDGAANPTGGVELLHHLLGKAEAAFAMGGGRPELGEHGLCVFRFAGGSIAALSHGVCGVAGEEIAVYGTKGCLVCGRGGAEYCLNDGEWTALPETPLEEASPPLNDWIDCIRHGRRNAEHTIDRAIAVAGMLASAAEARGREIALERMDGCCDDTGPRHL